MEFRWNTWNLDHATAHGIAVEEIEMVGRAAQPPYPEEIGGEKFLIVGRGQGGRWVQIIFVVDEDGSLYVIHARPLTEREKRRTRRRLR